MRIDRRTGIASTAIVVLSLVAAGLSVSCGAKSPTGPSKNLTVTSISPATGSTLGGTVVTVLGTQFAAGAAVTIGGTPANNVTVQNSTSLTATTGQHPAGAGDVVVTIGDQAGTLPHAFTYVAPAQTTNQPPVINSVTALGARPQEPASFADLNEVITVTASVSDAETPVDRLDYQWSAPLGTFTGTGASVKWQTPQSATTPADVILTLTVIEQYQSTDDSGLPVTKENRTTGSVTVSLHNSAKEVGDMAVQYLIDFSQQKQSPNEMLRNFTDCAGRDGERDDIIANQRDILITKYSIGAATVTFNFKGICAYRSRPGDACIAVPVDWHDVIKATGSAGHASGIDRLTGYYRRSRWWLCDSDFDGVRTPEGTGTH